jgi:Zn-dependent protease with chaperone function
MIQFHADYFDGKTSRAYPVIVVSDGINLAIRDENSISHNIPISSIIIDPPLGTTARSIRLEGGQLLETKDNQSVNAIRSSIGLNRAGDFVHFLESHWRMVTGCIVFLVFFMIGLVYYAIPYVAEHVSRKIPFNITASASDQAFKMLDRQFFAPSTVRPDRQKGIKEVFEKVTQRIDPMHAGNYRLAFRSAKVLGANAFALPSGQVIITDELIALSTGNDELAAIFAHEVTHIQKRHAIRSVLQGTGIFFLVTLMTGDLTSIANFAAFLPTLIVESGYSRNFEREADREAARLLIADGKGIAPFRDILYRIDASHPETTKLGVFSSHPETMERIRYLEEIERNTRKLH